MTGIWCYYKGSNGPTNRPGLHTEKIEMTTDGVIRNTKWSRHLVYTCPKCDGTKIKLLEDDK